MFVPSTIAAKGMLSGAVKGVEDIAEGKRGKKGAIARDSGLSKHEKDLIETIVFTYLFVKGVQYKWDDPTFRASYVRTKMLVTGVFKQTGMRAYHKLFKLRNPEMGDDPNLQSITDIGDASGAYGRHVGRLENALEENKGTINEGKVTSEQTTRVSNELTWDTTFGAGGGRQYGTIRRAGVQLDELQRLVEAFYNGEQVNGEMFARVVRSLPDTEFADVGGRGINLIDQFAAFGQFGRFLTRSLGSMSDALGFSENAALGVESMIWTADNAWKIGDLMHKLFKVQDVGKKVNPLAQQLDEMGAKIDEATGQPVGTWAKVIRAVLETGGNIAKASGNAADAVLQTNEALMSQGGRFAYSKAQERISAKYIEEAQEATTGMQTIFGRQTNAPKTVMDWGWRALGRLGGWTRGAINVVMNVMSSLTTTAKTGEEWERIGFEEPTPVPRLIAEPEAEEGEGDLDFGGTGREEAKYETAGPEHDAHDAGGQEETKGVEPEEEPTALETLNKELADHAEAPRAPEAPVEGGFKATDAFRPETSFGSRLSFANGALHKGMGAAAVVSAGLQLNEAWTGKTYKGADKFAQMTGIGMMVYQGANVLYQAGVGGVAASGAVGATTGSIAGGAVIAGATAAATAMATMAVFAGAMYVATSVAAEHHEIDEYENPDFGNDNYNDFMKAVHKAWERAWNRTDMQEYSFTHVNPDKGPHPVEVTYFHAQSHGHYNPVYVDDFGYQGTSDARHQMSSDIKDAYDEMYEKGMESREPPIAKGFYNDYKKDPNYSWHKMKVTDVDIGRMIEGNYENSLATYTEWTSMKQMYGMKYGVDALRNMQANYADVNEWYDAHGRDFARNWSEDSSYDATTGYLGKAAMDFSVHDQIIKSSDGQVQMIGTYFPVVKISAVIDSMPNINAQQEGSSNDGTINMDQLFYWQAKNDWIAAGENPTAEQNSEYANAINNYKTALKYEDDLWKEYSSQAPMDGEDPGGDSEDHLEEEAAATYQNEMEQFTRWVENSASNMQYYGDGTSLDDVGWTSEFYFQLLMEAEGAELTEEDMTRMRAAYDGTTNPETWLLETYIPQIFEEEAAEQREKAVEQGKETEGKVHGIHGMETDIFGSIKDYEEDLPPGYHINERGNLEMDDDWDGPDIYGNMMGGSGEREIFDDDWRSIWANTQASQSATSGGVGETLLKAISEINDPAQISTTSYYVPNTKRGGSVIPHTMVPIQKRSRSGQGTSHVVGNQATGEDLLRSTIQMMVLAHPRYRSAVGML